MRQLLLMGDGIISLVEDVEEDGKDTTESAPQTNREMMRSTTTNCATRLAKPLRSDLPTRTGSVTELSRKSRHSEKIYSEVQACGVANPSYEETTAFTLRDTVETGSGGGP
jgi:hypothetical protein